MLGFARVAKISPSEIIPARNYPPLCKCGMGGGGVIGIALRQNGPTSDVIPHQTVAVRCGAVRCGAVRCGVVRCGVVWCGVVSCRVVSCSVVCCGVVWFGVAWKAAKQGSVTIMCTGPAHFYYEEGRGRHVSDQRLLPVDRGLITAPAGPGAGCRWGAVPGGPPPLRTGVAGCRLFGRHPFQFPRGDPCAHAVPSAN